MKTVRELFPTITEDVDVFGNYTDELCIAFCPGYWVTPEGEKEYADVLDLKVYDSDIIDGYVTLMIDSPAQSAAQSEALEAAASRFLLDLAGYCSEAKHNRMFYEVDEPSYSYEIWALGYDEDGTPTGEETQVCAFPEQATAQYVFHNINLEGFKLHHSYSNEFRLEKVKHFNGSDECEDVIDIAYLSPANAN